MPPKDDVLAPGILNEGTPGPRWFDFTSAPDMPGFDSSSCATDITWAGQRAFRMNQREMAGGQSCAGVVGVWVLVRVGFGNACLFLWRSMYLGVVPLLEGLRSAMHRRTAGRLTG